MKSRIVLSCLLLTVTVWGVSHAQTKLSKEEWQQEMQTNTKTRDDLKQQLESLNKDVADLKQQVASLDQQIQAAKDATMALVGATAETKAAFERQLSDLESTVDNLARMSDSDLLDHKADVDRAQTRKDRLAKEKIAAIPEYDRRLQSVQQKLDGLKRTLADQSISAAHEKIYVVKTWARDRDCLWNIAKKPTIYDNAFLWTKIYQANKDQIRDPNLIYPNQRLTIPPAGPVAANESKSKPKVLAHRTHRQ